LLPAPAWSGQESARGKTTLRCDWTQHDHALEAQG
jgi:hypothetical protein